MTELSLLALLSSIRTFLTKHNVQLKQLDYVSWAEVVNCDYDDNFVDISFLKSGEKVWESSTTDKAV